MNKLQFYFFTIYSQISERLATNTFSGKFVAILLRTNYKFIHSLFPSKLVRD